MSVGGSPCATYRELTNNRPGKSGESGVRAEASVQNPPVLRRHPRVGAFDWFGPWICWVSAYVEHGPWPRRPSAYLVTVHSFLLNVRRGITRNIAVACVCSRSPKSKRTFYFEWCKTTRGGVKSFGVAEVFCWLAAPYYVWPALRLNCTVPCTQLPFILYRFIGLFLRSEEAFISYRVKVIGSGIGRGFIFYCVKLIGSGIGRGGTCGTTFSWRDLLHVIVHLLFFFRRYSVSLIFSGFLTHKDDKDWTKIVTFR